jgi:hypothetical protein
MVVEPSLIDLDLPQNPLLKSVELLLPLTALRTDHFPAADNDDQILAYRTHLYPTNLPAFQKQPSAQLR